MEWQVKYEPATQEMPWSVYKTFNGQRILDRGFLTEEEAKQWASKQEKERYPEDKLNRVDEASAESFPASDPPAWIKTPAHPVNSESKEQ